MIFICEASLCAYGNRPRYFPRIGAAKTRMRLPCGAVFLLAVAAAVDEEIFTARSYDGTGNNEDNPTWGAAGTTQVYNNASMTHNTHPLLVARIFYCGKQQGSMTIELISRKMT